ncbi:hypothetical protein CRM22_010722, partial [Opisthorchis felineus]
YWNLNWVDFHSLAEQVCDSSTLCESPLLVPSLRVLTLCIVYGSVCHLKIWLLQSERYL